MKNINYTPLLLVICLQSCTKSFLEINDNTKLYTQNYVKDARTLETYSRGILQELASVFEYGMGSGYAEVVADNLKPAYPGTGLFIQYNWEQTPDPNDNQLTLGADPEAKSTNPLWKTGYGLIRNCNFVLEVASKYSGENPTLIQHIKGQVLALRAYLHFRLSQVYAQHYSFSDNGEHPGIPYITSSDVTQNFPRLTTREVYNKIIQDLEDAQTLLPNTFQDSRAWSQASVKALLSRVHLYKEDYGKAQEYAMDVIQEHPLMQIAQGYPNQLFKYDAGMTNGENILQLSPQGGMFPGATYFLGMFLREQITWYATTDVAAILKEDLSDIRSSWVENQGDAWVVNKFPENVAPGVTPAPQASGAYYQPIIRSAELYLTIAECAARTGKENTAQDYLNAIRRRANPNTPLIAPVGGALLDSIFKERRKELAFEGMRMSDLQRWKLGVHRTDALPGSPKDLPYPSDKAIAPIPPNDVRLAGIPQNNGY